MPMVLRLIADCATARAAATLQQQLLQPLARWRPHPDTGPRPHGKTDVQYLFVFLLAPATRETLIALRDQGPGPWHEVDDDTSLSVVWDRRESTRPFLHPGVAWAELLWHR